MPLLSSENLSSRILEKLTTSLSTEITSFPALSLTKHRAKKA